ncbi:type III-A CRISPR-associated RAMP protein Csm5 [Methanobrevibacter sp.]
MKCTISVKSPVHIGSGEKYTASEYVKSKAKNKKGDIINILKRIDVSNYFLSLSDDKKDDFLRDLSNPNFNLKNFDSKIPNTYTKYRAINKSKKDIAPTQEITEAIKTLNQLYIPGSSIKGAIKSAILYRQIDDDLIEKIADRVLRNNGRVDNRQYSFFMNRIFTSNNAPTPAQGDIMKFLQVSDSTTIKNPTIFDVATVMASFRKRHNEFYSRNNRTHEPTLSYLETIGKNNKLSFSITNNYDYDVFRKLGLDSKKDMIDIDNIKKSVFIFSRALINHEIEFAEDYDIGYLAKFYRKLQNDNSIDAPLLRVGGGSGFLSTTVGLKIKKYDEMLFEKIRDGTRGKTYEYSFPKSRKITQVGGLPLGWIQLNFKGE